MKKKIFWTDEAHLHFHRNGKQLRGGLWFRAFDLVKFMKKVEEEAGEVVGLCFEGNNVDVIIKENETDKQTEEQNQA